MLTESHEEKSQPVPPTKPDVVVSSGFGAVLTHHRLQQRGGVDGRVRHGRVPESKLLLFLPRWGCFHVLGRTPICAVLNEGETEASAGTIPGGVGGGEEVRDHESNELEEEGSEQVENKDEDTACWKVVDKDFSRI